jgi:CheY-like chemotaxis protein
MSSDVATGPIRLDRALEQVRAATPGADIDADLKAKGLVRDPLVVERMLRDLLHWACAAAGGKRVMLRSRDLVRVDQRGQPGRWTEVILHEPTVASDDARARISTALLTARARIAATLLIAGDGRAPVVEVARAERQGTTVRLVLPCIDPPDASKPVVLLVDDDETIRQAIAELLRTEGYQVIAAPNGQVALERATRPVDLLLTDLVMPGMSGLELARRLGDLQPGVNVMYMSGLPIPRGSVIPGAFISKPLDLNVLLAQLPGLLAGIGKVARPVPAAGA